MKNHVPVKEYILVTEEFDRASGGMPGQKGTPLVEECEGIGKVNVTYYVPDSDLLAPTRGYEPAPAGKNDGRDDTVLAAAQTGPAPGGAAMGYRRYGIG